VVFVLFSTSKAFAAVYATVMKAGNVQYVMAGKAASIDGAVTQ